MTSLVFGNFYFEYYSYRFGLGFRLGLGLGLELGLRLGLGLRVSFFGFITKCLRARNVRQAFSYILSQKAFKVTPVSGATMNTYQRALKPSLTSAKLPSPEV